MRRASSLLGSLVFLLIAPATVAGVVPWWISGWSLSPWALPRVTGGLLTTAGVLGLLDSFARFALQGLGTPAPVFPTRHLVVTGLYRYCRNPMYIAVVATILGQGLMFLNAWLLAYGAAIWLGFHAFVKGYEEPTLRRTFGEEYEAFCHGVPRWIPRVSPWRG